MTIDCLQDFFVFASEDINQDSRCENRKTLVHLRTLADRSGIQK